MKRTRCLNFLNLTATLIFHHGQVEFGQDESFDNEDEEDEDEDEPDEEEEEVGDARGVVDDDDVPASSSSGIEESGGPEEDGDAQS